MTLESRLAQLEQGLRVQDAPVLDLLAPGLDPATIAAELSARFGSASRNLVVWYAWHNGLRPEGATPRPGHHLCLITRWVPLALAETTVVAEYSAAAPSWDPRWLPIAKDRWTRVHLLTVDATTADAQVMEWHGEDGLVNELGLLENVVAAWIGALAAGLYWDASEDRWAVHSSVDLPPGLMASGAL